MYYRIAIQINPSPTYQWKSTLLSSLGTLFQWLRLHQALPQDQLRVFTSSTREDLNEQLMRENNGWESNSVTAEHFLHERGLSSGERRLGASKRQEQATQREQGIVIAVITTTAWNKRGKQATKLDDQGISSLERRRLELEDGAGGDHDSAYAFTFPTFTPQALAWMKLLVSVQNGELQP